MMIYIVLQKACLISVRLKAYLLLKNYWNVFQSLNRTKLIRSLKMNHVYYLLHLCSSTDISNIYKVLFLWVQNTKKRINCVLTILWNTSNCLLWNKNSYKSNISIPVTDSANLYHKEYYLHNFSLSVTLWKVAMILLSLTMYKLFLLEIMVTVHIDFDSCLPITQNKRNVLKLGNFYNY